MKNSVIKVFAAFIGFVLVMAISGSLFSGLRLDLTEQKIYTLSDGTKRILSQLDQPVELTLYYSDKASENLTSLRAYAKRVIELLDEYVILADGKLSLTVIDPVAFSEAEDKAAEFGLQAVPIPSGDSVYFGMTAKNEKGDDAIVPFFQPDKEAFLEYEVTELIYRLSKTTRNVVGLATTLDIRGGFDMQRGGQTPPWTIYEQLDQLYDLRWVDESLESIESDIELLILVQPKTLDEVALYQLEQYVLRGGKLIVFTDPKAETDNADAMMSGGEGLDNPLAPLFEAWGVNVNSDQVVADGAYGLTVSMGQGRPPVRHVGLLGVQVDGFNPNEIALADLEVLNFASAGFLEVIDGATTTFDSLVWSSTYAQPVDVNAYNLIQDPSELQRNLQPSGDSYTLAARISGPAKAVIARPETLADEGLSQADNINVMVVADTDVLSDRLWVQVQNFFGQRIVQPWADNGAFMHNLVEQYLGSSDLISIRSRGRFVRPFEVVQDLQQQAETDYLENERVLQQQLEETEARLAELEKQRGQDSLTLSPEQEAALMEFQREKLRIRKALRDVRHELDKDIEGLGTTLKVLNIAVAPLLLTLLMMLVAYRRLARR